MRHLSHLAASALLLSPWLTTLAAECISGGTERDINLALKNPNQRALLCHGARFRLSASVVLSADGQELATVDSPPGSEQAILEVVDPELATAIHSRASDIWIHHVAVDGARAKLGRLPRGGALLELGGNVHGVSVDHVRAFDPRGWSVLHVFEGANLCTGARIINNQLGPAGHGDGEWADGLSFACRQGIVENNVITDASDGGIVIFGSPGTTVANNTIITYTNTLLGGINLVDYKPTDGDYSGVIVRGNRIEAPGGYIKIAIAVGPAVWGDRDPSHINRGGLITGNTILGNHFAYGIAVDGVTDFTITDNTVHARFSGVRTNRCWPATTSPGQALVRNPRTSTGSFEAQFTFGSLGYAICAEP